MDLRKRVIEKGVVCKLDMEKAYDKVNWDFLLWVLRKKGLGRNGLGRWKDALVSLFFSMLINGTSKGFFKSSRGLRQGDPLSPFLFSFVADGLSEILRKAEMGDLVEGFVVGEDNIMVSHLQFADDSILFLKAVRENITNMELCLKIYEVISRLRATMSKSCMVAIHVEDESV